MKKTTTKKSANTKSAATKPAAAKSAAAPAAPAVKAPAKKGASSTPARRKSATVEAAATVISARVDIGFGNHLYLRGEGPGLSWDHGIAMDCIAADGWAFTLKGATAPVVFKVLLNDEKWCSGNDYVVEPGQSVTVTPTF